MSPAFSIVIPTCASRPQLARLLPALVALDPPRGGFEVIVVDDGAADDIEHLVRSRAGALAVRCLPEQGLGRAHCLELGWRAATGDTIVFLDPDMVVDHGWLLAYERALADGADVVSGARWWIPGEPTAGETAEELTARAQAGLHGGPVWGTLERELDHLCQRRRQGVLVAFAAQAGNLAISRRALEATSGFNVLLRQLDDVELGIRLWESGARFAYNHDALAVRCTGDDAGDEARGAWPDDACMQALFWRHPYGDLLRLQLWARRRQAGDPAAGDHLTWLDQPWDPDELRRELGEAGPGPQTWAEADLVAQLARAHAVPTAEMADQIARGVEAGLYHEIRDGVRHFQLDRLEDWLRDATPYLQRNYHNDQVLVMFRDNPDVGTPSTLSARGRIHVSADPDALAAAGVTGLNLPLPVERSGQRAVEIVSASTPALLAAARKARGMLAGYPASDIAAAGGAISVDFTFQVSAPMSAVSDDVDPQAQLRVVMPPEYQQRALDLVRSLGAPADPFEAGRAIFEWIEGHILFGGIPPQHPYYRVLDFGSGICIQQIRLFVAMCRVAGIPAREVCGALFPMGGEGSPSLTKQVCTRGFSPFGHSWAEYHVPGRGWVPAELRGFGRRGFIPLTVPDPSLRQEFQRVLYQRYPFGALHPYRIVSGPASNRLAPLQLPPDADPIAAKRALDSIAYDVTCTFTRLPPG